MEGCVLSATLRRSGSHDARFPSPVGDPRSAGEEFCGLLHLLSSLRDETIIVGSRIDGRET